MDKNWLIRTKSNHILGPISKEKVLELYNNRSIKPDDEICTGNGFWFFVREEDMVGLFLVGNETQTFNPISEAKDVLTSSQSRMSDGDTADITLVGGLNLSMLKTPGNSVEVDSEGPDQPADPSPKKKSKFKINVKPSTNIDSYKPLNTQSYLKYLGILSFILLFLMVYFRKTIIRSLFEGEVSSLSLSLFSEAHAQEDKSSEKKKLLDTHFKIEEITFKPSVSLNGLDIESYFDIEKISCDELKSEVYQLGVILYPPEVINEKFLIRMRDCVLKLADGHPLKKWMKWVALRFPLSEKEQKQEALLNEIITSSFNLITDTQSRNKIINILHDISENTVGEKLLKSYLYLMIGNVTRSDNILRDIIKLPPVINWQDHARKPSLFQRIAVEKSTQIFQKFDKHPADRKTFKLFCLYLQNFYNNPELLNLVSEIDASELENKIKLRFTENLAPAFVHYLRLSKMKESSRIKELRKLKKYPQSEQAYWIWPFMEMDPLISDKMNNELLTIEKQDELWFVYLMNNEKLADIFARNKGKSFLPGRRHFLREALKEDKLFMMALYKILELGDINQDLVNTTVNFITHD